MKKINHGEAPMDGTVLNQAQEIMTRILVLGGGKKSHDVACLAHMLHTCISVQQDLWATLVQGGCS